MIRSPPLNKLIELAEGYNESEMNIPMEELIGTNLER